MNASVHTIPGCGKVTASKMKVDGIVSIRDLFLNKDSCWATWRSKAELLTRVPVKTQLHSWYGLTCHILRYNDEIVRAILDEVVLENGHLKLYCMWLQNGMCRRRMVTPTETLLLNALWKMREVISVSADGNVPEPMDDILPPLTIDGTIVSDLSPTHATQIDSQLKRLERTRLLVKRITCH